jgi:hypothetical protein
MRSLHHLINTGTTNWPRDDIAEIIAIETRSALPIEDKVAMSMAVISRTGVQFIRSGTERIAVSADH